MIYDFLFSFISPSCDSFFCLPFRKFNIQSGYTCDRPAVFMYVFIVFISSYFPIPMSRELITSFPSIYISLLHLELHCVFRLIWKIGFITNCKPIYHKVTNPGWIDGISSVFFLFFFFFIDFMNVMAFVALFSNHISFFIGCRSFVHLLFYIYLFFICCYLFKAMQVNKQRNFFYYLLGLFILDRFVFFYVFLIFGFSSKIVIHYSCLLDFVLLSSFTFHVASACIYVRIRMYNQKRIVFFCAEALTQIQ